MKKMSDTPACIRPEGHCWHVSITQHAIMNHQDELCCWCAADRCLTLNGPPPPEGHGPWRNDSSMWPEAK